MSVTFDANATADVTANGVTSITNSNLTVGAGSNRAVVAQLCLSLKTASAVTVNWDQLGTPVALTLIKTANGGGTVARAELWGLINPVSGAKQMKAAWTGASDVVLNQTSWTNVHQSGGATSFPDSTSGIGSSTGPTLAMTSDSARATMANMTSDAGAISAPTQTQTFLDNLPLTISTAGSRATGANSVTHAWSLSPTGNWVVVSTSIQPAPDNTVYYFPYRIQ